MLKRTHYQISLLSKLLQKDILSWNFDLRIFLVNICGARFRSFIVLKNSWGFFRPLTCFFFNLFFFTSPPLPHTYLLKNDVACLVFSTLHINISENGMIFLQSLSFYNHVRKLVINDLSNSGNYVGMLYIDILFPL